MNLDLDLVQCLRCGKVREKFLVGCPNCGVIENRKVDPKNNENVYYEINLEVIKKGADFYKRELTDEQKTWFKYRIPNGQSWQFYAGILTATRLSLIWLNPLLPFEMYSQPISVTNSRVYYVMSFMTEEKRQNFCDFLNTFNPNKEKNGKGETNIQGETLPSNDKSSI